MKENKVHDIWVLADNQDAVKFYKSCGFDVDDRMAVYMTRPIRP